MLETWHFRDDCPWFPSRSYTITEQAVPAGAVCTRCHALANGSPRVFSEQYLRL